MEVNYLGSLFRFSMKNEQLMIKQTWDAWCNLCKSFVHKSMITYICMFILAEETCVSALGAAHKSPSLRWMRSLSVSTAVRTAFLCLDSVAAHKDMFTLLTSRHSKIARLAEELRFAAQRPESDGQLWNAASHHTQDPGGRQRETPQKQLQVRWLFHVFISQRWSINLDWHSLESILCVLICVYVHVFLLKEKRQGQGTACLYSWCVFHLNWHHRWLHYMISPSIPV